MKIKSDWSVKLLLFYYSILFDHVKNLIQSDYIRIIRSSRQIEKETKTNLKKTNLKTNQIFVKEKIRLYTVHKICTNGIYKNLVSYLDFYNLICTELEKTDIFQCP